jgi:hypothetical protein
MGSSHSPKPGGIPAKLLSRGRHTTEAGLGAGNGGGAAPSATKAFLLERVSHVVAARISLAEQIELEDDGFDITVRWQRQTLGHIRHSDLDAVRGACAKAARVAKILLPANVWIALLSV